MHVRVVGGRANAYLSAMGASLVQYLFSNASERIRESINTVIVLKIVLLYIEGLKIVIIVKSRLGRSCITVNLTEDRPQVISLWLAPILSIERPIRSFYRYIYILFNL